MCQMVCDTTDTELNKQFYQQNNKVNKMTKGRKEKINETDRLEAFVKCFNKATMNEQGQVARQELIKLYCAETGYSNIAGVGHLAALEFHFTQNRILGRIFVAFNVHGYSNSLLIYGQDSTSGMQIIKKIKELKATNVNSSQLKIGKKCEEIKEFLLSKNKQYGDSALSPIRIFSKSNESEQLKVRIDDKLNRLMQGDDSLETDNDIIMDLIGYLILYLILEEQ